MRPELIALPHRADKLTCAARVDGESARTQIPGAITPAFAAVDGGPKTRGHATFGTVNEFGRRAHRGKAAGELAGGHRITRRHAALTCAKNISPRRTARSTVWQGIINKLGRNRRPRELRHECQILADRDHSRPYFFRECAQCGPLSPAHFRFRAMPAIKLSRGSHSPPHGLIIVALERHFSQRTQMRLLGEKML